MGADTNVGAGQGPPGGMLDVGPLQRSSTQKPLREACTWGGVLGLLNTKFLRRNRSWEDQVFFFFDPPIFNINAKVQNRASFSKMYSSLIS